MAEPGDLVPPSQRTRVERPLAQARGQQSALPAVSPASATSSPGSLVPNYVQLNADAAGAMPDSPTALQGDSPMVSPIELSAFKRQRAAGDDADRSAVAPTVAATTRPVTASATPHNAPDVVTADQVAPPAVLLLRQIDAATQASAPPAMARPPWQDVEAGAAELGFPASGLLLPLESQQVSGKRPQVAGHMSAPEQTPPAPAPIVEVTIGRVEIRAVQAARPATKPKAAPSAPALSLEAYLSQQQGSTP